MHTYKMFLLLSLLTLILIEYYSWTSFTTIRNL